MVYLVKFELDQLLLHMRMDEFFDPFYESNHTKTLVNRYEQMRSSGENFFFDVEEFEDLLDHYIDERNSKKAFEVLAHARTQHPFASDLSVREAELLSTVGRNEEALKVLEKIELLEPNNADLKITHANILSQMGNIKLAIHILKQALKWADEELTTEILLSISFEHQSLGEYNKAIDYLKRVLNKDPFNDDALYELAFCLDQTENDIGAVEFFNQHVNDNPYSHHAWFNLGNAYLKLELYEKATEAFDYAIVIKEDFASAYFSKALAYMSNEQYNEAVTELHASLEYELIDSVTYYYLGECFEKLGDLRNSEKYYKKATQSDPNMANAWLGLATIASDQGREFESLALAKRAINIDSKNGDIWYTVANLHKKLGFLEESMAAYEKALELTPTEYSIYLDYSELLFDHEMIDEANEVIETGMEKLPEQSEIYYRFAAYLLKNGQEEDALDYLAQGIEIDSEKVSSFLEYYPESLSFSSVLSVIEKMK